MGLRRFGKFGSSLAQIPVWALSWLVPRKADLWVFGAWRGQAFSDNPKYLYTYVKTHCPRIEAVWITKSRTLDRALRAQSVDSCFYLSPRGLYCQLRARAIFFTHTQDSDFLGAAVARNTYSCQLWHGTPLKKIMFDDPEHVQSENRLSRRLAAFLFPWLRNRWSLIVAPSGGVAERLQGAFKGTPVAVTGYPRNDSATPAQVSAEPRRIREVIYMPTFRGAAGSSSSDEAINALFDAAGFDIAWMDARCAELDMVLTIRLHPSNRLRAELQRRILASNRIRFDQSADFYACIDRYDVLITDYSSVFFDFLLTGKPVIHAGFDVQHYIRDTRAFYQPYEDICLTPGLSDWPQVMALLERFIEQGLDEAYRSRYARLAAWANDRFERSCSENVVRYVEAHLSRRA
ncbi:CDP-glycerol glycerophosphotransferase family protein [Pseudomonas sp. RIT-PI-AD]|uniref:CDP-glycerol glycerophosphotransferase family protein n=1 Tax=Pseudomonas sp. RIT-PI-AD TaxID=3035294 RepID=UPI0021DA0FF7|nr:CDP-glycerol glycerophosphotransferase family protein [Pseudomonas sp. RIT-PI-AD]